MSCHMSSLYDGGGDLLVVVVGIVADADIAVVVAVLAAAMRLTSDVL